MATKTVTIPNAALPRIGRAMARLYPIPLDVDGNQLYTETQWAWLGLQKFVVEHERAERQKELADAVSIVSNDDTVISVA